MKLKVISGAVIYNQEHFSKGAVFDGPENHAHLTGGASPVCEIYKEPVEAKPEAEAEAQKPEPEAKKKFPFGK